MELDSHLERFVEQLLEGAVKGNRQDWREWIEIEGPGVVRQQRADRGGFELRLQARWHDAFEKLELLHWMSTDLGAEAKRRHSASDDAGGLLAFVLFKLHAQACLIGSEVLALLRTGHAAGAMARWRSLHETAAVLLFVKKHGHDVAERYLLHDRVRSRRDAVEYHKHNKALGYEPLSAEEIEQVERDYKDLFDRFGKPFVTGDYGWAQHALFGPDSKQAATFKHIEQDVELDHIRPYYRLAGHSVHANPAALSTQLGLIEPDAVMLAGPSNYGLADPGKTTAHSLSLATVTLLTHWADVDFLAVSQELMDLATITTDAFMEAQSKIEREEAEDPDTDDA